MSKITAQTAKFFHCDHERMSFGYHLDGDTVRAAFAFRSPADQPNRKVAVRTILSRLNGEAGNTRSPNASIVHTARISEIKAKYPDLGTNAAMNRHFYELAPVLYTNVLSR